MNYVERKIGKSRLILVEGDITKQVTYAIVNSANDQLSPGGGVCGIIHKVAGPELWEECKTLGGCETGEVKITRGYNLPAKYIIHTVGPIYTGIASDKENLAKCYRNTLDLALQNAIKSIAFPSISTGIYRYPVKEASLIALTTIINYLKEHQEIERVRMVLHSVEDFNTYWNSLKEILDK
ncbi:MAG: macro domain-containing protein [Actinobacteria bacterium]|nr:macro domain-containing protein [Actinomycetota bacterium]